MEIISKQDSGEECSIFASTENEQALFNLPQLKIPTKVFEDSKAGVMSVAREISDMIRIKQLNNQYCVLGLATGSTPIEVYSQLIRMHRQEGLSFENVVTFNLDEYYPICSSSKQSYNYFMYENLFKHVDIPSDQIHIPKGDIPSDEIVPFCKEYEGLIDKYGGIDIQILGIGRTGHIGFNEPGADTLTQTRLVNLDPITREDATKDFGVLNDVPLSAITMGISTIFKAKKIILMAWGKHKANILAETIKGSVSKYVPASYLQIHPNVKIVIDKDAALYIQ